MRTSIFAALLACASPVMAGDLFTVNGEGGTDILGASNFIGLPNGDLLGQTNDVSATSYSRYPGGLIQLYTDDYAYGAASFNMSVSAIETLSTAGPIRQGFIAYEAAPKQPVSTGHTTVSPQM